MSDWFQHGQITTLSRVGDRSLEEIEDDLRQFTAGNKVALVLPALYSEFERPAMNRIITQLAGADYLYRIVLSLDRASESQFEEVKRRLSKLPTPVDVIWNDGPGIRALLQELRREGFYIGSQGKGRGVWLATGLALADRKVGALAYHDCDIANYDREMLARLIYPLANNAMDFEFTKGYYTRVAEKLYGRVTRLYFTPIVAALRQVIGSEIPLLEFYDSFRYPLAGEFAFVRDLATRVRLAPNWGLEVSTLAEVYRSTTPRRVCQVEIADNYDHKHQALCVGDDTKGLAGMSEQIAATLLRVLSQNGNVLSRAALHTLRATYHETSLTAIEQYHALARINGLNYDRHTEKLAVEVFSSALARATEEFLADPAGEPALSSWLRIRSAIPSFSKRLVGTVRKDNAKPALAAVS